MQEELELLRQLQQQKQDDDDEDSDEQVYENFDTSTIKRAGGHHIDQVILILLI